MSMPHIAKKDKLQIVKLIRCSYSPVWPRGYKTFFMLNSVEHEILNAHKYKNIKEFGFFGSDKPRMPVFPLINVKMPINVKMS